MHRVVLRFRFFQRRSFPRRSLRFSFLVFGFWFLVFNDQSRWSARSVTLVVMLQRTPMPNVEQIHGRLSRMQGYSQLPFAAVLACVMAITPLGAPVQQGQCVGVGCAR